MQSASTSAIMYGPPRPSLHSQEMDIFARNQAFWLHYYECSKLEFHKILLSRDILLQEKNNFHIWATEQKIKCADLEAKLQAATEEIKELKKELNNELDKRIVSPVESSEPIEPVPGPATETLKPVPASVVISYKIPQRRRQNKRAWNKKAKNITQ